MKEEEIAHELETLHKARITTAKQYALVCTLLRELEKLEKNGSDIAQSIRIKYESHFKPRKLLLQDGGIIPRNNNVVESLKNLEIRMAQEVDKMEASHAALKESSSHLDSITKLYEEFDLRLSSAKVLLNDLKRRSEQDSKYVFWSFVMFCIVCIYIIGKRTRLYFGIFFVVIQPFLAIIRLIKKLFSGKLGSN